ncbi:MAG TPA: hypothetical protein VFF72_03200 [Caldimonas sp.]|nr:hypothetical protein [Caldimonas sp.]
MRIFEGFVFLAIGVGLIAMTLRSLGAGWLPCGSRGFAERLEFRRDEEPLGYWAMFVVYGAAGVGAIVFGLRLLTGHATPLPLH